MVLTIDFGQGAAKIPEVKVGVQKKYLPISPVGTPLWLFSESNFKRIGNF